MLSERLARNFCHDTDFLEDDSMAASSCRFLPLLIALILQGCAGYVPPNSGQVEFRSSMFEFSAIRYGCVFETGKYKDLSGLGNPHPSFRFIATSASGVTQGQWMVFCDAVVPNGISTCRISGPRRAHFQCGEDKNYQVVPY